MASVRTREGEPLKLAHPGSGGNDLKEKDPLPVSPQPAGGHCPGEGQCLCWSVLSPDGSIGEMGSNCPYLGGTFVAFGLE